MVGHQAPYKNEVNENMYVNGISITSTNIERFTDDAFLSSIW